MAERPYRPHVPTNKAVFARVGGDPRRVVPPADRGTGKDGRVSGRDQHKGGPAADLIAGFCRFSWLGKSDWSAHRQRQPSADELAARARLLYDEDRLAARFAAFETICLPSILAQDDPRFVFVIITSPELPARWMDRLRGLCAASDALHLEIIGDRDLMRGLRPLLTEMTAMAGRNLIQFRLDDDDALAAGAVARLRGLAARMADLPEFAVSMALGLSVAVYPGRPVMAMRHDLPFLAAGLAVKLADPGRSLFGLGHFAIPRRMTHIVDRGPPGTLLLKWPSDSRPLDPDRLPPYLTALDEAAFRAELEAGFPWLAGVDFTRFRDIAAAAHPALIAPAGKGIHTGITTQG